MHKPTLPSVLPRFRAYHKHKRWPNWGSLQIVLDDLNVEDADVQRCIERARDDGDKEGERLGRVLLSMSRTQRRKLAFRC